MKQPIRYFAIGLFTAAAILLLAFYKFDTSKANLDNLSTDEMIEAIKTDGYHVVTEDEYITLSVNDEQDNSKNSSSKQKEKNQTNTKKKNKAEKNGNKKENDETQTESETFTINIESGMLPSEISETLAENNIIKDATKFDQYLEKNDYSQQIQLGKHKLNNKMSREEIAEELTK